MAKQHPPSPTGGFLPGMEPEEPRTLPRTPGFEDLPPCRDDGTAEDALVELAELEARWVGPTHTLVELLGTVDDFLRETRYLSDGRAKQVSRGESKLLAHKHRALEAAFERTVEQLETRENLHGSFAYQEWSTASLPREGLASYTVLIRDTTDPERSPRVKGGDKAPHRTLDKTPTAEWKPLLLELMERRPESTMNALTVLLVDKTADVIFETTLFEAFEELLKEGKVEHTTAAPVLWRVRREGTPGTPEADQAL